MSEFFRNNKTKVMGGLIVVIGFLQLTDNAAVLQRLMGDNGFAIWNLVAGAVVVLLGFLNTAQSKG